VEAEEERDRMRGDVDGERRRRIAAEQGNLSLAAARQEAEERAAAASAAASAALAQSTERTSSLEAALERAHEATAAAEARAERAENEVTRLRIAQQTATGVEAELAAVRNDLWRSNDSLCQAREELTALKSRLTTAAQAAGRLPATEAALGEAEQRRQRAEARVLELEAAWTAEQDAVAALGAERDRLEAEINRLLAVDRHALHTEEKLATAEERIRLNQVTDMLLVYLVVLCLSQP
jgi:chromosome segregation ATPase